MGREVAILKDLVAKQVDTIESIKGIDFDLVLNDTIGGKDGPNSGNTNFSFEDIDADLDSLDEDVDVNILNKSMDTTIGNDESGSSWGMQKKKSSTGPTDIKSPKLSSMTAS